MVLDPSAFRDYRSLQATFLSTPFVGVGTSLFRGQFQPPIEEATRSQEQLSGVRHLTPAGSKAALKGFGVPS